jgi:hypothetical protein
MNSFANLKRNRGSLDKLTKAIETLNTNETGRNDDRFWLPTVDKAGNGTAIIRFLPAASVDGEDALPWVRIFSHGFQGPGGWYIEDCLTTISGKCPACEHNSVLWNSGIEANKEIVRKQKRRLNYISNILVISDPANPENEGQIKLFKYGKKIFDKISDQMNPEFEDEKAVNPFDFWEGANFRMKIRNVEGYRNYDKSEFASPSALFDGDDSKIEDLWKKEYGLQELIDPSKFKSPEDLQKRLSKALGSDGIAPKTVAENTKVVSHDTVEELVAAQRKSSADVDADDEAMDYFKNLANQA